MKKVLLFSAMVSCMVLFAGNLFGQKAVGNQNADGMRGSVQKNAGKQEIGKKDSDRQGTDVTGENCFAIIAGKATTVDGSVLFAHNEDDSGEQMLNVYIVPAGTQPATTEGGLKIPASIANGYKDKNGKTKAKVNGKFFWVEFPGMSVADAAMNQWGVCIASDGCNSREDKEDVTDGGILYDVRIDVAKYARSARDAVKIIGEAVEQYGYKGSGRTYCVADPNEGWIVAVVQGRHWVAQRVPDDKVMAIPNYYTITRVDLEDTENFMGSPDIIDYAISRGWYDPHSRQEFNFRLAYSDPKRINSDGNTKRHKKVIEYITDGSYKYDPFSVEPMFTPAKKLSIKDMMVMLSIHNEREKVVIMDAPKEPAFGKEDPRHIEGVCTDVTIVSTIFQLRSWMPLETGCIMWMCPGRPCAEVYVPWYLGMTKTPAGWSRYDDWQEAEQHHFSDAKGMKKEYPEHPYWFYTKRWNELNANYSYWIKPVQENKWQMQYDIFKKQQQLEESLPANLKKGKVRKETEQKLNQFTEDIFKEILAQKTIQPKRW